MQPRRNYCISFFFAVITSWIAVAQSGVNCTGTECFTITAARKNDANVSISTTTRNLISRIQNNTQSAFTTKSIITDPTSVSLSASSTTTPGASNTTTSIVTNRCSTISILQAMDWCDPSIMPIFYIFFAWSAICTTICVTACACITWQSCSSKNLRKIKSFVSITYFDNNVCVTLSPASTPRPLNRFSLPTSPRDFSNFVHSIVTNKPRPRPEINSPCSNGFDGYTGPYTGPHPGIELTSPRNFSNFIHSIVTNKPRPRPGINSPCSNDSNGYTGAYAGPHPGIELTSPRNFSNFVHSIVTNKPRPRPEINSPCSNEFNGYTGPHPGIELTSYVDIV